MDDLIQNKQIPHFFDGFYDDDIEWPRTLAQALRDFEAAVETIKKVTQAMRGANFDSEECAVILDMYYGGEMTESEVTPSERDNYYYVLSMPELRDVEFALETLGIESGEIKQRANKLKSDLWLMLPDFYKGHAKPLVQPLAYNPEKPYPYSCVEGSLIQARRAKLGEWGWALEHIDEYGKYMPDDAAPLTTIEFKEGNVMIDGKTAPSDIHWTEMYPFDDMLSFAEDVINNHDPTYLSIDPEGPEVEFYTSQAPSPQDVKLVVYWDSEGSMLKEKTVIILSAIVNRRQLAQCFITECEEANKSGYNWDDKVARIKALL